MNNHQKDFYKKMVEASNRITQQARKGNANYIVVNQKLAKFFQPINELRKERIKTILELLDKEII